MANSGWLGELDTNKAYINASLIYAGTNKTVLWMGQGDTFNAFVPNILTYSGTLKVMGWLAELDSSKEWLAGNSLVYWAMTGISTSNPPGFVPAGPGGPILNNGYPGMTWMKNCYVIPRDFWPDTLSQPYAGQLWPVPNSGGARSGQTFPF
jgi:hypothetical protein